jgi:hypothetical protein
MSKCAVGFVKFFFADELYKKIVLIIFSNVNLYKMVCTNIIARLI